MDMKKIGAFLKELRREKGVTQEQLAERFGVSARTVSRWETGVNMPDFDLLIELTDYYQVEIKEILNGERTGPTMDKETKETLMDIADYNTQEKQRLTRRMCGIFVLGLLCFILYIVLDILDVADTLANGAVANFALGVDCGIMLLGVLYTSGHMAKIHAAKQRMLGRK